MKAIPLENFAKGLTSDERKQCPVVNGCLLYFPDAVLAISNHSLVANNKHNPGQKLHWDKSKSTDELDSAVRHIIDLGKGEDYDENGLHVEVAIAWRGLANLQRKIDRLKTDCEFELARNMANKVVEKYSSQRDKDLLKEIKSHEFCESDCQKRQFNILFNE